MALLIIVLVAILMQYNFFGMRVGAARVKYDIKAPAIVGHPEFERHYRIQQNTLEQLVVFIPMYLSFAIMAEQQGWPGNEIASALGVLWIVGRFIYAGAYIKDPAKRGAGFLTGFAATALLMIGTVVAAVMSLMG